MIRITLQIWPVEGATKQTVVEIYLMKLMQLFIY